ncbi:MAG: NUDIX hydrolase [Myxococcota bacterium]
MHRQALLTQLDDYRRRTPTEAALVERYARFVREHSDCFLRSCLPGHVTASAWIVCPRTDRFLLTHHRKLGRWLQLGGHADGDPDVQQVALREAREESGLETLEFCAAADGSLLLDLDVHRIPARSGEPAHEHFDARFLLLADSSESLQLSEESHDLRWNSQGPEANALLEEESLQRMMRKADARRGVRRAR